MSEHAVGVVTHYWDHLGVAGVHVLEPIDVGDHIHVHGHTTDFEQDIDSMEIQHRHIVHANVGDDVGIHVAEHAREHDTVFKLECDDIGEEQHDL